MLLVFDNCEHLLDACARLADRLLRAAPRVKLLASSREPMRIPGEEVYPVPALAERVAEVAPARRGLAACAGLGFRIRRKLRASSDGARDPEPDMEGLMADSTTSSLGIAPRASLSQVRGASEPAVRGRGRGPRSRGGGRD